MARRCLRPRSARAVSAGAVVAAAWLAGAVVQPVSHAQPGPASESELDRAKDLYKSAEAAIADGRFDDAVRDYGAAYELSKDPALFFKIGRANERAGRCDVAVSYYARYLRDGNPTEQFAATTRERIVACGGDVPGPDGSAAPVDRITPRAGSGSAPPSEPRGDAGSGSAAVLPEPMVTLEVNSNPEGAEIYINSGDTGKKTHASIQYPRTKKTATITLKLKGYDDYVIPRFALDTDEITKSAVLKLASTKIPGKGSGHVPGKGSGTKQCDTCLERPD